MKKFIVETYYTCTFKTVHTLKDLNDNELSNLQIRIASSKTNADLADPIFISTVANTTDKFRIISRVSDKKPGEAGHPIQYDTTRNRWFVHTLAAGNTLHAKNK